MIVKIIGFILIIGLIIVLVEYLATLFKQILDIVSYVSKFVVGIMICSAIEDVLGFSFDWWLRILYYIIGAVIIAGLIIVLGSSYRLVGYAINYFVVNMILSVILQWLGNIISIDFIVYAAILFLAPRIIWISDRFVVCTEYKDSDYDFWSGITTEHYTATVEDFWENAAGSWHKLPIQIVIACVFYAIGSGSLTSKYPIGDGSLQVLCIILATVINLLFDLFVFKAIDNFIDKGKG